MKPLFYFDVGSKKQFMDQDHQQNMLIHNKHLSQSVGLQDLQHSSYQQNRQGLSIACGDNYNTPFFVGSPRSIDTGKWPSVAKQSHDGNPFTQFLDREGLDHLDHLAHKYHQANIEIGLEPEQRMFEYNPHRNQIKGSNSNSESELGSSKSSESINTTSQNSASEKEQTASLNEVPNQQSDLENV